MSEDRIIHLSMWTLYGVIALQVLNVILAVTGFYEWLMPWGHP